MVLLPLDDEGVFNFEGGCYVKVINLDKDSEPDICSYIAAPLREKYSYDAKNQLVRHDSVTQNASFTWDYDNAGNITAWKRYAYTTGTLGQALETRSYVYGDTTWGDLLTSYNGQTIGYDAMGNMSSYNGMSYTWKGRELSKIQGGGNTYTYKYNAEGIRTRKTVNGTTTEYFLNGTQILAQKTDDAVMWFFYDSEGHRVGLMNSGIVFYYLYNAQGDVVAIVKASTGQVVARYAYDAWGKCTVTSASGYAVGTMNPFRYRGYYFDQESGLYYLNSRYYSPEFGRFISPDDRIDTGAGFVGYNVFAYCGNNPVVFKDPSGRMMVYDLRSEEVGWRKKSTEDEATKAEKKGDTTPKEPYGTIAVGGELTAAFGLRVSVGVQLVMDIKGSVGLLFYSGAGGGFPAAASTATVTITSAKSIDDLCGWGSVGGGSAVVGIEAVAGSNYGGFTVSSGPSVPLPEAHGEATYTWVVDITEYLKRNGNYDVVYSGMMEAYRGAVI